MRFLHLTWIDMPGMPPFDEWLNQIIPHKATIVDIEHIVSVPLVKRVLVEVP